MTLGEGAGVVVFIKGIIIRWCLGSHSLPSLSSLWIFSPPFISE